MGNFRWGSEGVDVINPQESPFVHVEQWLGEPRYTASAATGLDVYLGRIEQVRVSIFGKGMQKFVKGQQHYNVPILPPLAELPPLPIKTSKRIEDVVEALLSSTRFIEALR